MCLGYISFPINDWSGVLCVQVCQIGKHKECYSVVVCIVSTPF